ncbi:thioredoxin reductase [Mycetocola sp. BIGb0189]|uniref:FAD-dependent oxidoreductase n=1 Tax=Mycetocola sp. BIGb0189 TaxID=2940604 RepID=UPI002167D5FA|nr:FAD-dependent oxidoreductase [Mycetocola sp. BIGb0189]MCS4276536.1 thioredoxin reductase [Mycetocola sp. BIGb0189]
MSTPSSDPKLPVIVIGAGPIGLAAAAHLVTRGLRPLVLEAGAFAGAAIREWGHVSLFSPWGFNTDAAARALLEPRGWVAPDPERVPTGAELVREYIQPLAAAPEISPHIRYGARVVGVGRRGIDKTRTVGRERHPLLVRVETSGGIEEVEAAAIIDASGTWSTPNPLGASGYPAAGEAVCAPWLVGALPDVLGRDRARFAGRSTLVVGLGHSAANTLLALVELAESVPGTEIFWAIRGHSPHRLYGGGDADELPARGALGTRLRAAVDSGRITLLRDFAIHSLGATPAGRVKVKAGGSTEIVVDAIAAATGFRPDLDMLREVRLDLDPVVEAPARLAPLIDPNHHSCGTVEPHGAEILAQPETGVYIVGMKSYGRAPTFLLATGYEQVRSVVAAIAGDHEAAARVELILPESGVCCVAPGVPEARVTVGFPTGLEHGFAGEVARG